MVSKEQPSANCGKEPCSKLWALKEVTTKTEVVSKFISDVGRSTPPTLRRLSPTLKELLSAGSSVRMGSTFFAESDYERLTSTCTIMRFITGLVEVPLVKKLHVVREHSQPVP